MVTAIILGSALYAAAALFVSRLLRSAERREQTAANDVVLGA
jgi:hypothetical protein